VHRNWRSPFRSGNAVIVAAIYLLSTACADDGPLADDGCLNPVQIQGRDEPLLSGDTVTLFAVRASCAANVVEPAFAWTEAAEQPILHLEPLSDSSVLVTADRPGVTGVNLIGSYSGHEQQILETRQVLVLAVGGGATQ
jgi:hypothetical protein